jgi:valyl-tRNA synthetase
VTLGYPENPDFKNYYPTTVMETGADILFFWVARMMMLGIYRTNETPFKNIYLHGLVRDKKGLKMSKSKGNVTAPTEISEKYGTDALRMGLIVGNTPGTDLNLDPDKINAYKKFANKIWNISRFVLDATSDFAHPTSVNLSPTDQLILDQLRTTAEEITLHLEKFQFHLASEKAYHYVWHELADKILEESKVILAGEDVEARTARQYVLYECLTTSLKLLHPFMPFVTEVIWQNLPKKDTEFLMIAPWPQK